MLRSSHSRFGKQASQPFICWRCLSRRGLYSRALAVKSAASSPVLSYRQPSKRFFNSTQFKLATLESNSIPPHSPESSAPENLPSKLDFRDHLRQWEIDNAPAFIPPTPLPDNAAPGEVINQLTRPMEGDWEVENDDVESSGLFSGGDYLLDVGIERKFLRPGDLVELTSLGGSMQELAIYIRDLEKQSQFYTMSGKWIHRSTHTARFCVPHFVDPNELDDIYPYLPTTDVPEIMQNNLHSFPQSIPRGGGKSLIRKMLAFWNESDKAYQAAAGPLDNAHASIAHVDRFTYLTLEEIAEKVLPETTPRNNDGTFPAPTLYAVHRSILRNGVGITAQKRGTLRSGGQYEVHPLVAAMVVDLVKGWVREYQAKQVSSVAASPTTRLEQFAIEARKRIDKSRKSRPFTPYGTVGPVFESQKGKGPVSDNTGNFFENNKSNRLFLKFIESWAALESFALHSSINGIGSAILRAIDRYNNVDLNTTTAWTFLQEVGAISPWENRANFELRLDVSPSFVAPFKTATPHKAVDRLAALRKDWKELAVYCIDDSGAHEIDDGISIEPTDASDQYWIHVHTADPASHIAPGSAAAKHAESFIQTVYMPERVFHMLDTDYVHAHLSLARNRPCLTFSAKMNMNGEILDYAISAGRVHNVLFLTPGVLHEVVLETPPFESHLKVHRVGPEIPIHNPSRAMLRTDEISNATRHDLELLHRIGEARVNQLQARGGFSGGNLSPSVQVSLNGASDARESVSTSRHSFIDPSIVITPKAVHFGTKGLGATKGNAVQTFMLVAGEVAARWCNDRGLPVPFRVTPRNPDKTDPVTFYNQTVAPSIDTHGNADAHVLQEYFKLLRVQPSATPGPHAAIGVEMMAKCTSPLRRFGDLLLHYQVEAALLEEYRLGRSLVGNTVEDFLPFTRTQVEALLPQLDTRERILAFCHRNGEAHWICHFLIRAWLFKESPLPSKLPFLVRGVDPNTGWLNGSLLPFLIQSNCMLPEHITVQDITIGDMLEVEIKDVNVYLRAVKVQALRRLESLDQDGGKPEEKDSQAINY